VEGFLAAVARKSYRNAGKGVVRDDPGDPKASFAPNVRLVGEANERLRSVSRLRFRDASRADVIRSSRGRQVVRPCVRSDFAVDVRPLNWFPTFHTSGANFGLGRGLGQTARSITSQQNVSLGPPTRATLPSRS
jgi:hypothetical protein